MTAPTTRSDGRATSRRRIGGLDAARAVAVIGMVMVHFGPTGDDAEGTAGALYTLPHGRASILFVLLAGMGVTLLLGTRSPGGQGRAWLRLGVRVALLGLLGLALQLLDHGVLVILQYYALYFLIAAAATRLGDRLLLGAAASTALAGPVVYLAAQQRWPVWFADEIVVLGDPADVVVRELFLSGAYPAVTWSAPLLLGVWLARRQLREPAVLRAMLAGGAVAALVAPGLSWALGAFVGVPDEHSWWQLVVDDPHSQMPLWLLGSAGSAVATLAACVWLVDRAPRLTWPAVATGQLAFTVYVAHLLILAAWPDLLQRDSVLAAAGSVAWFTAAVAGAATLWRSVLPHGPLEIAFQVPRGRGR